MKKKQSPLAGLVEVLKKDPDCLLAPELRMAKELEKTDPVEAKKIRKEFWEKAAIEEEERKRDLKERRDRTGKYDPVHFPLMKCKVCAGDVVERIKWEYSNSSYRIGSSRDSYRVHDCYYCKSCGIVYAFVPKQKKDTEEEAYDEDDD